MGTHLKASLFCIEGNIKPRGIKVLYEKRGNAVRMETAEQHGGVGGVGGWWNVFTQAGYFLYRADILLGVPDPLHLGEVWYGRALAQRVLVLNLSTTQVTQ